MSVRRTLQLAAKDENVVSVHVGPYLLLLLAGLAVLILPHVSDIPFDTPAVPPIRGEYFSGGYTSGSYWVWMGLTLTCPALVMLSYWLPSRVHDSRYVAIWLRAAGDAGQIFALLALEASTIKLANADGIYRHILLLGYVVFCGTMLTRDVYLIVASERLAHRISHRGELGED